jgi:hypothetical protein
VTVPVTRASHRTLVVYIGALLLAVGRAIQTDRADGWFVLAVALLAVADLTTSRTLRVLTAGLGAVTLATTIDPADDLPSGLLALLTLALIGWCWPRVESALGRFSAVLLFAGASLGVYATAPDTEEIILAGIVVVPALALLAWPAIAERAPSVLALLALVVWAAAQGGRGRPGAVVAGLACLALVSAPVAARRHTRSVNRLALVVVVHAAATVVIARVAGPETSAATAALLAAPIALGTVAADALVLRVAVDDRVSERMG